MKQCDYSKDCVHLKACRRLCVISKNELHKTLPRGCGESCGAYEKEHNNGVWVKDEILDGFTIIDCLTCSVCGGHTYLDYFNFCPNCGADMRGAADE